MGNMCGLFADAKHIWWDHAEYVYVVRWSNEPWLILSLNHLQILGILEICEFCIPSLLLTFWASWVILWISLRQVIRLVIHMVHCF